jgi:hypothetical protein
MKDEVKAVEAFLSSFILPPSSFLYILSARGFINISFWCTLAATEESRTSNLKKGVS